jgi:hypothetical protein
MLVWCTTSVHTTDLAEPSPTLGPVSGFRFSLYSAEINELGEFETTVPNWSTGDEFLRATAGASASSGSPLPWRR